MKLTKIQLNNLIKEEVAKIDRIMTLKARKNVIEEELGGYGSFDDHQDPADYHEHLKYVECPVCDGKKVDHDGEECYYCHGTGEVPDIEDNDPGFEHDRGGGQID